MGKLTRQQIEKFLHSAANIFGRDIDQGELLDYLHILFDFKRLSDQWDCEGQAKIAQLEAIRAKPFTVHQREALCAIEDFHRFKIPESCHWNNVVKASAEIGVVLNKAAREIADANPEFKGSLDSVDWNARVSRREGKKVPEKALRLLVRHFDSVNLSSANLEEGTLYRAITDFLTQFTTAGQKRESFFTRPEMKKPVLEFNGFMEKYELVGLIGWQAEWAMECYATKYLKGQDWNELSGAMDYLVNDLEWQRSDKETFILLMTRACEYAPYTGDKREIVGPARKQRRDSIVQSYGNVLKAIGVINEFLGPSSRLPHWDHEEIPYYGLSPAECVALLKTLTKVKIRSEAIFGAQQASMKDTRYRTRLPSSTLLKWILDRVKRKNRGEITEDGLNHVAELFIFLKFEKANSKDQSVPDVAERLRARYREIKKPFLFTMYRIS